MKFADEKELVTDGPTDRPMDTPSYQDAWTRLKTRQQNAGIVCAEMVKGKLEDRNSDGTSFCKTSGKDHER